MLCEFYDKEGQQVEFGSFSLLTKSLYRAIIDVQEITGYEPTLKASNFAVMASGDKRIVISI